MEMRLYSKRHVIYDRLSVSVKLTSVNWMESFLMVTFSDHALMVDSMIELAVVTHFRNRVLGFFIRLLNLFLQSLSLE